MSQETPARATNTTASDRDDRLKAALKANLARRKAQARARALQDTDETGAPEQAAPKKDI